MPTCVIMRGIPGSGKSTWARRYRLDALFCSADDFFMEQTIVAGEPCLEYKFDAGKIAAAHSWCYHQFLVTIQSRRMVVVDNTNIRLWEFRNYLVAAQMMGYETQVVEVRIPGVSMALACCRRCTHRVPLVKVSEMEKSFEPFPGATIVPPKFSEKDMSSYVNDLARIFPWRSFSAEEVLSWFPKEARP